VLQETFLFDGTVSENIAYSIPEASPEDIMRAAKIANAHDFIVKMSDGYDTQVGERGHRLSGGQKQRIAIARAILHNPRILILDEATASVDTETERKIQEAISRLVKGRTTFAIAHRLSTLRNADRLVVIDKGEIAEMGTHDELLDHRGIYFNLVEAQRELSTIQGVEAG
jgi:ATP-binding cassette, subfamily B, bacterial